MHTSLDLRAVRRCAWYALLASLQIGLVACKACHRTTSDDGRAACSGRPSSAPAQGSAAGTQAPVHDGLRARTVLVHLGAPTVMTLDGPRLIVMNGRGPESQVADLILVPKKLVGTTSEVPYGFNWSEIQAIGEGVRLGGVPVAGSDLLFTSRDDCGLMVCGPSPNDAIVRLAKIDKTTEPELRRRAIGEYPPRSKKYPHDAAPVTAAFIDAEPAFALSGSDLFFFAQPSAPTDERLEVMRMPRAGGPSTRVTTIHRGAPHLFLIADAQNIYFAEPGRLAKAPLAGGEASTVAKVVSAWAAVSDGEHVYFSDNRDDARGAIERTPVGGGPVETLATGFSSPVAMTLDSTSVWFVDADAENGAIYRVPKAGGNVEVIARGQKQPTAIVVDQDHVYWTNRGEGTVCRADK